jgi:hypothetical protein
MAVWSDFTVSNFIWCSTILTIKITAGDTYDRGLILEICNNLCYGEASMKI